MIYDCLCVYCLSIYGIEVGVFVIMEIVFIFYYVCNIICNSYIIVY